MCYMKGGAHSAEPTSKHRQTLQATLASADLNIIVFVWLLRNATLLFLHICFQQKDLISDKPILHYLPSTKNADLVEFLATKETDIFPQEFLETEKRS